jgi:hypothetical protein
VRTFAELLRNSKSPRALEQLGELMYQSHASYSACGLGSHGTDRLVALARELVTLKLNLCKKSKDFIVVSGFAESPGFKPLVFDPGDS